MATVIMSNDSYPIDPHAAYRKLLEHPMLSGTLYKYLEPQELQLADVKELIQQTLEALWRRRDDDDPPNNLPRIIALAKRILEGKLADFYRHLGYERRHLAEAPMPAREDGKEGAPDGPDQPNHVDEVKPPRSITPAEKLETKEQLAFVQEKIEDGTITHDDIEVMQSQRCGEKTLEELAAERGVKSSALRKRLQRIRESLKKEWNLRSTKFLVVMILLWLFIVTVAVIAAGRLFHPPQPHQDHTDVPHTRGVAPVVHVDDKPASDKPPVPGH
jgi:RNA polymerase sigma factor (sigma-70 family)